MSNTTQQPPAEDVGLKEAAEVKAMELLPLYSSRPGNKDIRLTAKVNMQQLARREGYVTCALEQSTQEKQRLKEWIEQQSQRALKKMYNLIGTMPTNIGRAQNEAIEDCIQIFRDFLTVTHEQ